MKVRNWEVAEDVKEQMTGNQERSVALEWSTVIYPPRTWYEVPVEREHWEVSNTQDDRATG